MWVEKMTSEHIETWWWNEAVEEKGRCYKNMA